MFRVPSRVLESPHPSGASYLQRREAGHCQNDIPSFSKRIKYQTATHRSSQSVGFYSRIGMVILCHWRDTSAVDGSQQHAGVTATAQRGSQN